MTASSTNLTSDRRATCSRRTVMAGCVGMAVVASLTPLGARAAIDGGTPAELFAFVAPDRADLVFAVALPLEPRDPAGCRPLSARLYAGASYWTIRPSAFEGSVVARPDGTRLFSGRVWRATSRGKGAAYLVVVAMPRSRVTEDRLAVWAEVVGPEGARMRVGHPVVSHLLVGDAHLARLHAASEPAMDRHLLSGALAERITARRGGRREGDVEACASRLADLVLPDVLLFDPARPGGFTFAAMNGRKPGDAVDPVVETLLAGTPRWPASAGSYRASSRFPYFATAEAV